jgi:hypothetical protein
MKYFIKILVLLSFLSLFNCTPEEKLIKIIEKRAKIVYDTIHVKDTFITKSVKYDTTIHFHKKTDSVFIKIKQTGSPDVYLNLKKLNDSLMNIKVNIPSDTLINSKMIAFQKFFLETNTKREREYKIFSYVLLSIIFLLIFLLFKSQK